jgi:hypothetical protein
VKIQQGFTENQIISKKFYNCYTIFDKTILKRVGSGDLSGWVVAHPSYRRVGLFGAALRSGAEFMLMQEAH